MDVAAAGLAPSDRFSSFKYPRGVPGGRRPPGSYDRRREPTGLEGPGAARIDGGQSDGDRLRSEPMGYKARAGVAVANGGTPGARVRAVCDDPTAAMRGVGVAGSCGSAVEANRASVGG